MANSEDRNVPESSPPPTLEYPPRSAPALPTFGTGIVSNFSASVGALGIPSTTPAPAPAPGPPTFGTEIVSNPSASTGIATNSSASVGALGIPSTASADIVFNFGTHDVGAPSGRPVLRVYGSSVPIHSVNDANVPLRKREIMLDAGEGTSEDRSVKANVEQALELEPTLSLLSLAPPQLSETMRTCYICKNVFDTMLSLFIHMHAHPEIWYLPLVGSGGDFVPPPPLPPLQPPERPNHHPNLNAHYELEPPIVVASAPARPVYRLPDLNFPAPEEEEE